MRDEDRRSKFRAPLFKRANEEWQEAMTSDGDPRHAVALPCWARDGYKSAGSEKDGYRDAVDRMIGTMIENGASKEYAENKAREVARRVHIRSENGGKLK